MLFDQLEEQREFTASEIQIANYILENPLQIAELTASELGKSTFTSKASVLRLCKKLGVAGYSDLRRKIELEMNERKRLLALLDEEPVNRDSSFKDVVNIIPSIYDKAVTSTKMMLDDASIQRIIHKIKTANKLDIYGIGITYSCAETAMFKFQSIGVDCTALTGINEHYIMSTKHQKNRVAIVISFTGENSTMLKTAEYLKGIGTYLIGIGGRESDKLKNVCDEYIGVYSKQLIMSMEMVTPFISITYIFDLLFAGVLVSNYDNNLKYALDVIEYKKILKENDS
ncbi:MurR/RpiR family transcriptional regulator [Oceanobacillus neutriphilus]|uniref:Transcriptional regulator n=1 Tax=Oceanobacillus neutriphilus TaxID=531815 RepID=A0ABQ2NPJ0_9BACI|nr:MurR/RpiR family transcriptional regulator [Oceanobacillus neutriphilus]GGP08490.1 transcriptional regulator [Oceanobacillus neutriphilus]